MMKSPHASGDGMGIGSGNARPYDGAVPSTSRKPVGLAEVAALAGVSTATAGRILGGYGTTKSRHESAVRAAAEQLGYRHRSQAQSTQQRTVALVVSDIQNPFFARLARGVAHVTDRDGVQVLIANTDEDVAVERRILRAVEERRIDGVIVAPVGPLSRAAIEVVKDRGIPVVLVDRSLPALDVDTFTVDNREAARAAVQTLIDAGHQSIAIATGASAMDPADQDVSTSYARKQGYLDALSAAGIAPDERYVRVGDHRVASAYAEMQALLSLKEPPTGIFATDLKITIGVMRALHDAGLVIGRDVGLAVIDDPEWAEFLPMPLTGVTQPAESMGERAARRLLDRIAGAELDAEHVVLETTLNVRRSHEIAIPPPRRP